MSRSRETVCRETGAGGRWAAGITAALLVLGGAGLQAQAGERTSEALEERVRALEEQLSRLRAGEPEAPASGAEGGAPDGVGNLSGDPLATPARPAERAGAPKGLVLELPWSSRLRVGGALRLRGERRDPADYRLPGTFGRPAGADHRKPTDFILMRTRLSLDWEVVEPLRVFLELQDSRGFGDTFPGADRADIHLRQAFVELVDPFAWPLRVRAGRFEVPTLGDGRLISPLDFSNVARSFDGFQATWALAAGDDPAAEDRRDLVRVTAFAAQLFEGESLAGFDGASDMWFSGLYTSFRPFDGLELDPYLFWRTASARGFASEQGQTGRLDDFTAGLRAWGGFGIFGASAEMAFQWGHVATDRTKAWASAVRAWANLPLGDMTLTTTAEYAFASGDRDPTDGKRQDFDPLFPFGHAYHGHMDLISWSNIHAGMIGFGLEVSEGLSFHLDQHFFWLHRREDSWRGAGSGIRRDPTGRARSYVGAELDLYVKYTALEGRIAIWSGFSRFFAGQYVTDTKRANRGQASDRDMAWYHLQVEVKF